MIDINAIKDVTYCLRDCSQCNVEMMAWCGMLPLHRELRAALTSDIPLDELEAMCTAWKDGRCKIVPVRVGDTVYARTEMKALPSSCAECRGGRKYGFVGDIYCKITGEYYTGNIKPPHKERPDECPLILFSDITRPEAEAALAEKEQG